MVTKRIAALRKDIEKAQKRLEGKPVCENFGQDEYRKLRDKYMFDFDDAIDWRECDKLLANFFNWCTEYCG